MLVFVCLSAPASAQRTWIEVRSPNFVVATDDGERAGRTLAWEFEQVKAGITALAPWARFGGDGPVVILAPRDEDGLRALAPQYWERGQSGVGSVSSSGPDRHYIALRADLRDDQQPLANPYQTAYWSYAFGAITRGARRPLPLWLSGGLAGMMSNMLVRDRDIQVGRLPMSYMVRVNQRERPLLSELLRVDRTSPWYLDEQRRLTFDAESAAFVHFLLFAEGGAARPRLDRFVQSVLSGTSAIDAAETVFGDANQLESAFSRHIARRSLEFTEVQGDASVRAEAFAARPLPLAESSAIRAGFHAVNGRPAEARARLSEARNADPNNPASYEVEGVLLDIERQSEGARAAYARAVELGTGNFYAHFRLGQMASALQTPEGRAQAEAAFERAVALSDTFVPALLQLGGVRLSLRKIEAAITAYERAVTLDPSSSVSRRLLATALMQAGRTDAARSEAEESAALAQSPQDLEAATQLLQRLQMPVGR